MGSTASYSSYSRLAPTPTPVSPSSKSPISPHRQPPSSALSPTQATRTRTSKPSSSPLRIATMPRFHPATYQLRHSESSSSSSSTSSNNKNSTTPTAATISPQTALSSSPRSLGSAYPPGQAPAYARPMSPLSQFHSNHHSHLHYYHQQQQQQQQHQLHQLHLYQRNLLAAAGTAALYSPRQKPASPQLMPLNSPGPVTPLALEEDVLQQQQQQQRDDYLACGGTMASGGTGSVTA